MLCTLADPMASALVGPGRPTPVGSVQLPKSRSPADLPRVLFRGRGISRVAGMVRMAALELLSSEGVEPVGPCSSFA